MQKQYGFAPLGAADGEIKNTIFGGNNARLYNFTPAQKVAVYEDKLSQAKLAYEAQGTSRSNMAYGYVCKAA